MPSAMTRKSLLFYLLSLILFALPLAGQTRRVLEIGYAGADVTRITTKDWTERFKIYAPFVGDLDGDGHDDFLYYKDQVEDEEAARPRVLVVVFGESGLPSSISGDDLRRMEIELPTGSISLDDKSYSAAGDIDLDGYADFMFGERSVVLVFGGPSMPERVSATSFLGEEEIPGLRYLRISSDRDRSIRIGREMGVAGDVNGDGRADLAISSWEGIGTQNGEPGAGTLYVLYGGFALKEDVFLDDLGQTVSGFVVRGAYGVDSSHQAGDNLGQRPTSVGDVNGDGYDDIAVSGQSASRNNNRLGLVYLIFGGPDLPAEITPELGEPDPRRVVTFLPPVVNQRFGVDISRAGDVDSDGLEDFLIGGFLTDPGFALLVYGQREWLPVYDSSTYSQLRHFLLLGSPLSNPVKPGGFGSTVCEIGDWNGDGFDDFAVGAPRQCQLAHGDEDAGRLYLIYGGNDLTGSFSDTEIGFGVDGLVIDGAGPNLRLGRSISYGGDFDGDGRPELLVESPFRYPVPVPSGTGSLYLIPRGTDESRLEIRALEPDFGRLAGGDRVTLIGSGLSSGVDVRFGGEAAQPVEVLSTSRIVVNSPVGVKFGPVDVEVSRDRESSLLNGGFSYQEDSGFRNLRLDQEWLADGREGSVLIHGLPRFWNTSLTRVRNMDFGDLDGDGLDDLVAGSPEEGPGRVTIVFGDREFPELIDGPEIQSFGSMLEGLPPEEGERRFGRGVTIPGDMNGDGYDDMVCQSSSLAGGSRIAHIVFGREIWPQHLALAEELAEGRAVSRRTRSTSYFRWAGDLNRDGFDDVLMTATDRYDGVSVFYGLESLDDSFPPRGVEIVDPDFPGLLGYNATGLGDINRDGWPDLFLGPKVNSSRSNRDESFLVLGAEGGFDPSTTLPALLQAQRAILVSNGAESIVAATILTPGDHVESVGDYNGDGIADALITDRVAGGSAQGMAYIILGSEALGREIREIDLASGSAGQRLGIRGAASNDANDLAVPLGDVNGDGLADIGIPTRYHPFRAVSQSRAYVVFGDRAAVSELNLRDLYGYRGFQVTSLVPEASFTSMVGGDLNGDGLNDVAIAIDRGFEQDVLVLFGVQKAPEVRPFIRGDVDASGEIDVTDAVNNLSFQFLGTYTPPCLDACDFNDDGAVDPSDPIAGLTFLFLGAEPPASPGLICGLDPTAADDLGCAVSYCR